MRGRESGEDRQFAAEYIHPLFSSRRGKSPGIVGSADYRPCDKAAETNYAPMPWPQKVVLIFDPGPLFPGMLEAARASGLKYYYVAFDQLAHWGTIEYSSEGAKVDAYINLERLSLRLSDVAAVMWVPPWNLFRFDYPAPSDLDGALLNRRWSRALLDLRRLIPSTALWLPSHPLNGSSDWQNRVSELFAARTAGLATPPFVFTNDAEKAAAFARRHGGRALWRETCFPGIGLRPQWVSASQIRSGARRLRRSPCLFMKYIEKAHEVRVVVIGDRLFAFKIDSQASDSASFDWRVRDDARVKWAKTVLPRRTAASILRLMKDLELNMGSLDLIKDRGGRHRFLEVNRPGATNFLRELVGFDVSAEIFDYLRSRLSTRKLPRAERVSSK